MNDSTVANVLHETVDRVFVLRIHRPEKKNALSQAMYAALGKHIRDADGDPAIRALLITGTPELFTSGNDIKDFLAFNGAFDDSPSAHFMRALFECRKPVVAAVNGLAIGIGTTMLLHCDLVYAGESARFQLPFVNIGIAPEYASTFLLPAMLGHRRASELVLTGETFDAHKAVACGLANAVVPDARVYEHALAVARQ